MLNIKCPYCGDRSQKEFAYGGDGTITRPKLNQEISDEEWGRYLFFRENPKGIHFERWTHDHGCRRWFNVMRDTVTDQIIKTYKMGEAKPEISNE